MSESAVEYRLVRSRWPVRYGICGTAADGRVAVVAPFSDDRQAVEQHIARLNEQQTPLEAVSSLFPSAGPLE